MGTVILLFGNSHAPFRRGLLCDHRWRGKRNEHQPNRAGPNSDKSDDVFPLHPMVSLRASVTRAGVRMFCRSDEVWVRIAPATIARQHIRPARFDRAILAIPMHVSV